MALQFTMPEELGNDWGVYRTNVAVLAKQINEDFAFEKKKFPAGSYVVFDGDEAFGITDDDFSKQYVPVSAAKADTNFAPTPSTPARTGWKWDDKAPSKKSK